MTCAGRRMKAMGMVDLPVNSVVDGTCVSRTMTRLTALGRKAMIARHWCCVFQLFHSAPHAREGARDPPLSR